MDTINTAKVTAYSDGSSTLFFQSDVTSDEKDTQNTAKVTIYSKRKEEKMIAIDFGTGTALQLFGPNGKIEKKSLKLPKVPGGKTPRDEFRLILEATLALDDVVFESATVGSSGCEPNDVVDIVTRSPHHLFTLPTRTVKNYRMDYDIHNPKSYAKYNTVSTATQEEAHVLDAEILYTIATTQTKRLRKWHIAEPCNRVRTSVRPHDKRGYRDEESDRLMSKLPPFETLPEELNKVLGVKKGKSVVYSRALVIPFAMAMDEPFLHDGPPEQMRKRFEKIVGLYQDGYPSFYRRATIEWMQEVGRQIANVTKFSEVPREQRKLAWKITQRQIRMIFHLMRPKT